jgi:hypothetical protein
MAFKASVSRGGTVIGSFSDAFAGRALGMGCYDGQTKPIGTVSALIGKGASQAQIESYLAGLTVTFLGTEALESASVEREIERAASVAEAEKTKASRQASQAKAEAAASAKAAAERSRATAQSMVRQPSTPAASTSQSTSQSNSTPSEVQLSQARAAELEQRGAVARQALADRQKREYDAMIARTQAAERTRQAESNLVVGTAQALVGIFAGDPEARQAKLREQQDAHVAQQRGIKYQCFIFDQADSSKIVALRSQYKISVGETVEGKLRHEDCTNGQVSFKRYAFRIDTPGNYLIALKGSGPASDLALTYADGDTRPRISYVAGSNGMFGNKNISLLAELPAGNYAAQVENVYINSYGSYTLSVTKK